MQKISLILLSLVLFVSACNLPMGISPTTTPTATLVLPTQTPTQTPTLVPPTATSQPTATPTPGIPMFTSNVSANCRQGPSPDYPVIAGIFKDQTVPILGTTSPERTLWWLVEKAGVRCWVWGSLGSTAGNLANIPVVAAPPLPTPSRTMIEVLFENNTEGDICKMDFYVGIDIVASFTWGKGEYDNDGTDKFVSLPIGKYDLIEAYNCKSKLVATLKDVVINKSNSAFALP